MPIAPLPLTLRRVGRFFFILCLTAAGGWGVHAQDRTSSSNPAANNNADLGRSSGPVQLIQSPARAPLPGEAAASSPTDGRLQQNNGMQPAPALAPAATEFERYVNRMVAPDSVARLGAALMERKPGSPEESSPLVPADYLLVPGDELSLTIWGSVDADLRLTVDRSGRVSIPRVGPVLVAGVRYADLPATLSARIGKLFKNFDLSVSLSQLRSIRVYVTGFASRPGAYSMPALSTLSAALMSAGGPSAAGSSRDIQLKRAGKLLTKFDLYDLLIAGSREGDLVLQPDDVVHIGPIGPQIAVIGSVNQPAVLEIKPGETIASALHLAGGFSSVADSSRISVERLIERNGTRVSQVNLPETNAVELARGDVLRVFSAIEAKLPIGRQNKRVVVEGEVLKPGTYVLAANSSIQDALAAAGGFAPNAFVFGTQFTRRSVLLAQQENYDRALRDLETDLTRNATTQRTATADDAKAQDAKSTAASRLVERLRSISPSGRLVFQLEPTATSLPALALEDDDRIYVPALPTSVGVFGSVFNTGSYLYSNERTVGDYLRQAGGTTRGADRESTFVIRANGTVLSALSNASWLTEGSIDTLAALPGDTVFVPEELNKTTFVQNAKDWTQIIYQLGLGVVALSAVK